MYLHFPLLVFSNQFLIFTLHFQEKLFFHYSIFIYLIISCKFHPTQLQALLRLFPFFPFPF